MKKVTVLPKHDSLSALLERFNEFFVQKIWTIRQSMDQDESTLSPSVPVGETASSVTVPDVSHFTPATMQDVEKLITWCPAKSEGPQQRHIRVQSEIESHVKDNSIEPRSVVTVYFNCCINYTNIIGKHCL